MRSRQVYKLMKLSLCRAATRRLPKRERLPLDVPSLPDSDWSFDFNRETLHSEFGTTINSERLIRIFERLRKERGLPQILRTDNRPEFPGESFTQ